MTSGRHSSSVVDLTNTNSCQLKSTHVTPTSCSRVTSKQLSWFGEHPKPRAAGLEKATLLSGAMLHAVLLLGKNLKRPPFW